MERWQVPAWNGSRDQSVLLHFSCRTALRSIISAAEIAIPVFSLLCLISLRPSCGSAAVQTIEFDEGAGAVLRIQPLRAPRDENTYECVARNSEGEVSVTAKLAIIRGEARLLPFRPYFLSLHAHRPGSWT